MSDYEKGNKYVTFIVRHQSRFEQATLAVSKDVLCVMRPQENRRVAGSATARVRPPVQHTILSVSQGAMHVLYSQRK